MTEAVRDGNHVTVMLFESATSPGTTVNATGDQTTGRLYVDVAGGSGTVTSVSVVTANGFAGTVANATTTPAITLTTTITGILKGNGTAISAATAGTDYVTASSTNTFTNKTYDTAGSGNAFAINGTSITAVTGTGAVVLANSPTFVDDITVGVAASATGSILFKGTTSGTVTLSVADAAGTWTMKLPTSDGDSGQFLQTDGSGNTSWQTVSAGGITIGTTTITSGTNTRILYNNAGVVGEYTLTGTGTVVVMQTAPTFATSITTPAVLATADDSGALGASGTAFSDLFLASGGVINWSSGDVTITHSANTLAFAGASSGYSFDALVVPATNDAGALGSTTLGWSDLHLATGGVINWANGEVTITETDANTLTVAGATAVSLGTSAVFTTGSIELGAASDTTITRSAAGQIAIEGVQVVTISNTVTLTNKTYQAPIIDWVIEPAADDTYEGEATNDKLAGDTIAQWDLVYLDTTSGRWEFADASAATTAGPVLLGLATEAGTDGNAINVLLRGIVRNDGWTWTGAGYELYVSETAKAMTETAPTTTDSVTRVVGYALSDDAIYFNPSNDWITHT